MKLLHHLQKRLGIAFGIVNRIVRVFGLAQMLKIFECVSHQTFIERTKIRGGMAKGISTEKMTEVPIHKLPVKTVVV